MRQRSDLSVEGSATAEGIPVAPDMTEPRVPIERAYIDKRVVLLCIWSIILAVATGFIAQGLVGLIGIVTNIAFYGRFSTRFVSPAGNHLGWLVLIVPVIGGLIVGVMARYGSRAIRGHGIPEAMEQVLLNESRIPARVTLLKPISAAISIGTGGPFGAEGPIIATGGALGSLIGQILKTTADERKTLLAAGAAAGMAATFGSPVSAVLLAVELLLFEFRPRSIVPVALASAAATAIRMLYVGTEPIFAMPMLARPSGEALAAYAIIGALVGWLAVYVTRAVYWVEDLFEKLPIHWMWWPAIGGLAVGFVGYFAPHTLGVGYDNIEGMVAGRIAGQAVLFLCIMKFISWSISLGSGTSGGTLAPLFTIGGGAGVALGELATTQFPRFGIDPRICALVGMAAMFAGASRALLASVVFAFETTLQPMGLLPLLSGCTAGFLVSSLLMRNTIMTEKLARRGVRVPMEYGADYLDRIAVSDACSHAVVTLRDDQRISEVQALVPTHQGFPVVDRAGRLLGVVTRRDFIDREPFTRVGDLIRRPPAVVFSDMSLREAADHMVREEIGRLPVVERADPSHVVGILTRSDLLSAHAQRLDEARR
ncbi:MAG: chloride channel protein [Acidobacteria bacterium]|nr:chloride channel protein [Acidobacteriota bacterium]MBV9068819.1 chloride channel protein [Acidobacteriota bacterium]MBV9187339.1 chloride channel protein [Acidobacteriota bacterium]